MINKKGKAVEIAIDNLKNDSIKKLAIKVIEEMPAWKHEINYDIAVKSSNSYYLLFDCNPNDFVDTAFKKEFELKNTDSNINNEQVYNINRYLFNTTRLGYLNCDQYYINSKPTTDVYVDCGIYSELELRIIFHSFRSFISPGFNNSPTTFENIPSSEPITIVAVKKLDGETYIAVAKSNTKFETINNLVFEKVIMEKLKEKLTLLNSIWK